MRLPRAEDEVLLYINVDGELLEVEGTVKRVHLQAAGGINMLTGQMFKDHVRTGGEITITLGSMRRVPIDADEYTVLEGGAPIQTIVVREEDRDALPPGA